MDTILIGIAGGTGSGKTTLADKLVESFGRDEVSILPRLSCSRAFSSSLRRISAI